MRAAREAGMVAPQAPQIESAPVLARAHCLQGKPHVLEHAQVREQVSELKRTANAGMGARRNTLACELATVQPNRAGTRLELSRDQVEVGGLARTIRPDDGSQRAGVEAAGDRIDRGMAAKADPQIARFEQRRRHRLLRIGTFISAGLISRTSSGTPQAKAGSFLILKWYMLCIAW